jgi:hypothetical protein
MVRSLFLFIERVGVTVALLTDIREMLGSNLMTPEYPD